MTQSINQPPKNYEHVYPIVRIDTYEAMEPYIKVVKVMKDMQAARTEVDRLNELNKDLSCTYSLQVCKFV